MATYETTVLIPLPPEDAFAFVSDFRHTTLWDPRALTAEKTTDGPIGVGTRFMLTGGMLPKDLIKRLRIPESVAGNPLPYDVILFDPPNEIAFEGENRMVWYRDDLVFTPVDDGASTSLQYVAKMKLKGIFAIGEPILQRMFKRIGDDATRDIPTAAAEHGGR